MDTAWTVRVLPPNIERPHLEGVMPSGEDLKPPGRKGPTVEAPLNYLKKSEQNALLMANALSVGKRITSAAIVLTRAQ